MNAVIGKLVENRIVIWEVEESRNIFGNGYYGKPLGISKPKGTQFDAPLVIDLIEGCYLIQMGRLIAYHVDGRQISLRALKALCRKQYIDFDNKYLV
ncbi:MAG TPA: tRNA-intron lyase, partial [Nitrososphaeraceae archaeon]|nr:tRNA-intron lyase [Nitrososphaeraceae archaeon]